MESFSAVVQASWKKKLTDTLWHTDILWQNQTPRKGTAGPAPEGVPELRLRPLGDFSPLCRKFCLLARDLLPLYTTHNCPFPHFRAPEKNMTRDAML